MHSSVAIAQGKPRKSPGRPKKMTEGQGRPRNLRQRKPRKPKDPRKPRKLGNFGPE